MLFVREDPSRNYEEMNGKTFEKIGKDELICNYLAFFLQTLDKFEAA